MRNPELLLKSEINFDAVKREPRLWMAYLAAFDRQAFEGVLKWTLKAIGVAYDEVVPDIVIGKLKKAGVLYEAGDELFVNKDIEWLVQNYYDALVDYLVSMMINVTLDYAEKKVASVDKNFVYKELLDMIPRDVQLKKKDIDKIEELLRNLIEKGQYEMPDKLEHFIRDENGTSMFYALYLKTRENV